MACYDEVIFVNSIIMGEGMPPSGEEEYMEAFVPDTSAEETASAPEAERASVVEALRLGSAESEQLLSALVEHWESMVGESLMERVGHVRNIAQLYREAGLYRRAFDALQDAADIAYNEFDDALVAQIDDEMLEVRREAGRE
jgi:hypothetical protein